MKLRFSHNGQKVIIPSGYVQVHQLTAVKKGDYVANMQKEEWREVEVQEIGEDACMVGDYIIRPI